MFTVVIPTYRRPAPLLDCIRSLIEGSLVPDEILVIGRQGDAQTAETLKTGAEACPGRTLLRSGWVTEPGHLPPVQKGVALAAGDIVVFVDDDVTVTSDWLEYLLAPFSDPKVGVVGGRVITPAAPAPRLKGRPGCTSWYGKHWGNVASIEGCAPLDVHAVMEGNSAWRRELLVSLKFDPVLNFDDASMYGLDLCLQARSQGYRVMYEPRALVYHHAAARPMSLERDDRPRRGFSYSRNYTYIMLKHLPWWRRPVFLAWWFLVGERGAWGVAALVADSVTGRLPSARDVWSAIRGKLRGVALSVSGAQSHG